MFQTVCSYRVTYAFQWLSVRLWTKWLWVPVQLCFSFAKKYYLVFLQLSKAKNGSLPNKISFPRMSWLSDLCKILVGSKFNEIRNLKKKLLHLYNFNQQKKCCKLEARILVLVNWKVDNYYCTDLPWDNLAVKDSAYLFSHNLLKKCFHIMKCC